MTRNSMVDILFYGLILISLMFVSDQAFAVQQNAQSNNQQLLFQYSNQTTPMANTMTTVSTDSSAYVDGEFMTISGNVGSITGLKFTPVQIFNPKGILIHSEQLPIDGGGSFHTSLIAGGVLWNKIGIYTIKTHYGSNIPSETTFYFGGKVSKQSVVGEPTIENIQLMRASGITVLYNEIDNLNETYFISDYKNNKKILLDTTKSIKQNVLNGEYYGTFVGLSKIETIANETLTDEGKAKIIPLVKDLKISLQIATSPEFPSFIPLVLGVIMMIVVFHLKNRFS